MSNVSDMDDDDFRERLQRYPYTTMKLQYAENYFNKFDYDMLTVRPNQADEIFVALLTRDDFRTIICSYHLNVNQDVESELMNFYYKAKQLAENYEKQNKTVRSKVQARKDQSIRVDGNKLPVESGQFVMVAEDQ